MTRPPAHPRRVGSDAGFTLIETLVALSILAVTSLGLLYGVLAAQRASGDSRARVTAASLAASAIETSRQQARTDLTAVVTRSWQQRVGSWTFDLVQVATWQPAGDTTSACDTGVAGSQLSKRVSVKVSWTGMGSTQPVRSDTLLAPGVSSYATSVGNLAVTVRDGDGAPAQLVNVSLAGPTARSQLTDDSGCAFFDGVALGTYTVTASRTGYVDSSGNAAPTATAGALAGTTAAVSFALAPAATIIADLASTAAGFPIASGTTVSLQAVSSTSARSVLPTGWPATVGNVFPLASGYAVWLGTCNDANPDGTAEVDTDGNPATPPVTSRVWPVSRPALIVPVTAGGTAQASLGAARLTVAVRQVTGLFPVAGVRLVARHAAETGTGCTAGQDVVLGTTGADGTVSATLPYGKNWVISSTNVTPALSQTLTLAPDDTYPRTTTLQMLP